MIYPFGLFLVMLLMLAFLTSNSTKSLFKNLFLLEITFSVFKLNYGYFLKAGSLEIQYGEIVLAATVLVASIQLLVSRLNTNVLGAGLALILVVLIGVVTLRLDPPDVLVIGFDAYGGWDGYLRGELDNLAPPVFSNQSLLMGLRVIFYVILIVAAKSCFEREDWLKTLDILVKISKVLILYGLIEIVLRYGLKLDLNSALNLLMGQGVSTGGGATRLQGFSREPSHYALALFNMSVLFLARIFVTKRTDENIFWLALIIVIGALANTFSFWVVVVSALFLAGVLAGSRQEKIKIFYVIGGGALALISVGAVFAYSWLAEATLAFRLLEVFLQAQNSVSQSYVIGVDYGSEASRIIGLVESFRAYLAHPFFGLGIGTTYCTSGFVSILANVGAIGLVVWWRLLTVYYTNVPHFLISVAIFAPLLVTSDLGSFYDTAYIALLPVLTLAAEHKHSANISVDA